ncbi:SIR2 family protein [Undibacterium umbellatum]|uniref:SIR2 family protein n=1 Tax=Undibacterium umbellatum TaxID=2762300 RepID=A0ABR6Z343_9BURK|nr:SIR2 family protein [Undibacterium umbellatum]MBC3906195.1 SIR2 family protein [Undibacterium umbellatum]
MTINIDTTSSLAFSMSANKGVYALLLGSGVSRASSIPTGWEITLDLVRKVAQLENANCEPDPVAWYVSVYDKQPDYSELLDTLCRTQAERQQLIRSYIEPNESEREDGLKQPTKAHRAIAELVKNGYVRVILTTNFDRLMELALNEVGITPTVLSTSDHIAGALPLVHASCTIVKIHGDYMDTRIRNTTAELAEYPKEINSLLDRVFDEYGLIICGWSADWDEALRKALLRAPYRRFSTYWSSRGIIGTVAKDLITHKGAHEISINGADDFFEKLSVLVNSLDIYNLPHPLSTAAAIISLKKYLAEDRYIIHLDDLVSSETNRLLEILEGPDFGPRLNNVDNTILTDRVRAYEGACTTMVEMAIVAGYWSNSLQLRPWIRAILKLSQKKYAQGSPFPVKFQIYPAILITYALGIGAIASGNLAIIGELFAAEVLIDKKDPQPISVNLNLRRTLDPMNEKAEFLEGKEFEHFPMSCWIEDYFALRTKILFQNHTDFLYGFDKLEFLWALSYAYSASTTGKQFWAPVSTFFLRSGSLLALFEESRTSLDKEGESSSYVQSKIFGETVKDCTNLLQKLDDYSVELSGHPRFLIADTYQRR